MFFWPYVTMWNSWPSFMAAALPVMRLGGGGTPLVVTGPSPRPPAPWQAAQKVTNTCSPRAVAAASPAANGLSSSSPARAASAAEAV